MNRLWRILAGRVVCCDCRHLDRCADGAIPDFPLCRVRTEVDRITGKARPIYARIGNFCGRCWKFRPAQKEANHHENGKDKPV